ncbi:hypothetical protein FHS18_001531 [Paenibacillus phyllosphaerae]|uniref:DUF3889 domain-containing protein n=1 Tax=Paenibacillus phyllosphaerae TaxID=274593 RepID=A0A7W5AVZ2_9BACL|nr:DUF3889 domain-containing protein [Paenibacillus phyllosphaerae]MBB3109479.1 hypothetical protein [Paenibacillus phyllosphaerae]
MRLTKTSGIVFTLLVLLMMTAGLSQANAEPPYAKWGRLAMKETSKRYHAQIIDYKHLGRKVEQKGVVSESFKLILNKNSNPFSVTVRIWFDQKTEQVIRIQFTEEGRAVSRTRAQTKMI